MRARTAALASALLAMFGLLALVQAYWQIVAAPAFVGVRYDQRAALRRQLVRPGAVRAAAGETVLTPVKPNGGWVYRYEYPEAFSQLTGYNESTGLQATLQEALLAEGGYSSWRDRLVNARPRGCDVELSLETRLQEEAARLWGKSAGCALVIRVSDGALLAAASLPGYDPVAAASDPASLEISITDPAEPMRFRPIQKLYRPGWGMAWVTAAAALDTGDAGLLRGLTCGGGWKAGRKTYHCTAAHGALSLREALHQGCTVAIQQLADRVGAERYRGFIKRTHLLDQASIYLPGEAGRMPDLFDWRAGENLAETAVGQGVVEVTPLALARFFLGVARGGQVVQPYLVSRILRPDGRVCLRGEAKALGEGSSEGVAKEIGDSMAEAAEALRGDTFAGENSAAVSWWVPAGGNRLDGEAWLVAMAPWPGPDLLVACVVEGATDASVAVETGLSLLNYARGSRVH